MNLEECIARLIDPEVWETVDYLRVIKLPLTAQEMTKSSLIAARRVIDGLNLDITTIMGHAGPITGIITGHIDPQEDA